MNEKYFNQTQKSWDALKRVAHWAKLTMDEWRTMEATLLYSRCSLNKRTFRKAMKKLRQYIPAIGARPRVIAMIEQAFVTPDTCLPKWDFVARHYCLPE